MDARSMCGWLTKAQVLGHFRAYSGIPATLSDQVISQEAQDHLEKSTREDGTEAEDKSSEAWQSTSELMIRSERWFEAWLPAILSHSNLNFLPGVTSWHMSKRNLSPSHNLDSVYELMKQGKHDCPCESVVTLDTCAVELPTIAALEMFRKKKKSKI